MQKKKVLLPLLMIGPAAIPAFADINMGNVDNATQWNTTGVSDGYLQNGGIKLVAGVGYLYSKVIEGPAGTYNLVFAGAQNIEVAVSPTPLGANSGFKNLDWYTVNEKGQPVDKEGKVVSFESTTGEFYIAVHATNGQVGEFTTLNIQLVFNPTAITDANTTAKTAAWKAWNTLKTTIVNPEDRDPYFQEGTDLNTEWEALYEQYAKFTQESGSGENSFSNIPIVVNGIETTPYAIWKELNDNSKNDKALLEIYNKYNFGANPNGAVEAINAITAKFTDLTQRINEENGYFDQYLANEKNYTGLQTSYNTASETLEEQKTFLENLKGVTSDVTAPYFEKIEEIQGQLADFQKDFVAVYGDGVNRNAWRNSLIDAEALQTTMSGIQDEIKQLIEDLGVVEQAWKDYQKFNFTLKGGLQEAYEALSAEVASASKEGVTYTDEDSGITYGEEDNYKETVVAILEKVQGLYDKYQNASPTYQEFETWNKENGMEGWPEGEDNPTAMESIQAGIDYMNNSVSQITNDVKAQLPIMKTALETLAGYQNDLNELTGSEEEPVVVPAQYQEKWVEAVKAAQDAIDAFEVYILGENAKFELDLESEDYSDYTKAAASASEDSLSVPLAISKVQDIADTPAFKALNELQSSLNEAWGKTGDTVNDNTVVGWGVEGQMEDTKKNIEADIAALNPDSPDFSTKAAEIEQDIKDMTAEAKNIYLLKKTLGEKWDAILELDNEWITRLFTPSYESLQEDIENLNPAAEGYNTAYQNVYNAVDNFGALAGDYLKAYKKLWNPTPGTDERLGILNVLANQIDNPKADAENPSFLWYIENKTITAYPSTGAALRTFPNITQYIDNNLGFIDDDPNKGYKNASYGAAMQKYNDWYNQFKLYTGDTYSGTNVLTDLDALYDTITDAENYDDEKFTFIVSGESAFEAGGTSLNIDNATDQINGTTDYPGMTKLSSIVTQLESELGQSNLDDATIEENYPGYTAAKTAGEALQSKLEAIKAEYEALDEETSTPDEYTDIDGEIYDLYAGSSEADSAFTGIVGFQTDVANLIANKVANDKLQNGTSEPFQAGLTTCGKALQDLMDYTDNNTGGGVNPKEFWYSGEVENIDKDLQNIYSLESDYKDLIKEIADAFAAGELSDNETVEGFESNITSLYNAITTLYNTIKQANEDHQNQVEEGLDVGLEISTLITEIQGMINDIDGEDGKVLSSGETAVKADLEKYLDALNAMYNGDESTIDIEGMDSLKNNWEEVNGLVTRYYNSGESTLKNEELMGYYDDLSKAAQVVRDYLQDGGYKNAVQSANNTTTANWATSIIPGLDKNLVTAINDYNYFEIPENLNNPGWKAFVEAKGVLAQYKDLQDYYTQINDLNSAFKTWLNTMNGIASADSESEEMPEPQVISEEDYQEWLDKATALDNKIGEKLVGFLNGINGAAFYYYADRSVVTPQYEGMLGYHNEVQAKYNKAVALLNGQGIDSAEYLGAYGTALKNAETLYAPGFTPFKTAEDAFKAVMADQLGARMNQVANYLDKANNDGKPYPFAEWALAAWDAEYQDALSTINDYIASVASDAKSASSEAMSAWQNALSQCQSDIADLNSTVKEDKDNLLVPDGDSKYKGYVEELEGYLAALEQAKNDVISNSKNNDLNNRLQADWLNWDNSLKSALEDLKAYADNLAGSGLMGWINEMNGLNESYSSLVSLVETTTDLASLDPSLQSRVEKLNGQITAGYTSIASQYETNYLKNQLYKEVQEAFEDALAFTDDNKDAMVPEGYDSWKAYFDAIDAQMKACYNKYFGTGEGEGLLNNFNYDDRDEWSDNAIEMEQTLCELLDELQSIYSTSPIQGILDNLNNEADKVSDALESANSTLDGLDYLTDEEKAAYEKQLQDIADALDAEKNKWEEQGDRIIAMEDQNLANLDDLNDQIEEIVNQAVAENNAAKDQAQKETASNAVYDQLYPLYEEALQDWELVKDQISNYAQSVQDNRKGDINNVDRILGGILTDLNNKKDSFSLTDADLNTSDKNSLASRINSVNNSINWVQWMAAKGQAEVELKLADAEGDEVLKALGDSKYIVNRQDIFDRYEELNKELQGYNSTINQGPNTYERFSGLITRAQEIAQAFKNLVTEISEGTYTPGDIDGNGINFGDVQTLIDWIGSNWTYQDEYAEDPAAAMAADLNGNKQFDIADVTELVALINDYDPTTFRLARAKASAKAIVADNNNTISVALVNDENGVRTYAVILNNPTEFRAGQLDLNLEGSARIIDISGATRTMNHDLHTYDNGTYIRVIMANMSNLSIDGTDGEILYFDVEGKGDVTINGVVFADTNNVGHELQSSSTTGVNSILDTVKEYGEKIYDAAGRIYNRIQKGINIIRHKDGSVTKEIRK